MADNVTLELTEQGGHVGFIGYRKGGGLHYWLEERVVAYLEGFEFQAGD
jgi:predicted alpha/beta-fold hydrolase